MAERSLFEIVAVCDFRSRDYDATAVDEGVSEECAGSRLRARFDCRSLLRVLDGERQSGWNEGAGSESEVHEGEPERAVLALRIAHLADAFGRKAEVTEATSRTSTSVARSETRPGTSQWCSPTPS